MTEIFGQLFFVFIYKKNIRKPEFDHKILNVDRIALGYMNCNNCMYLPIIYNYMYILFMHTSLLSLSALVLDSKESVCSCEIN